MKNVCLLFSDEDFPFFSSESPGRQFPGDFLMVFKYLLLIIFPFIFFICAMSSSRSRRSWSHSSDIFLCIISFCSFWSKTCLFLLDWLIKSWPLIGGGLRHPVLSEVWRGEEERLRGWGKFFKFLLAARWWPFLEEEFLSRIIGTLRTLQLSDSSSLRRLRLL